MAKQKDGYPKSHRDDRNEIPGSGSARRFLRHLDRHLVRFSGKITALEERANRLSTEESVDLIVTLEELQRETLLLRVEIRERLAGGSLRSAEMMEYAEESWKQLKETFAELKESLEPSHSAATSTYQRFPEFDGSEEEDDDLNSSAREERATEVVLPEIHPPRVGPRR